LVLELKMSRKRECECEFSSKYGYVNGLKIRVEDYSGQTVLCEKNNELIYVNPSDKAPHFRHKNCKGMGEWHRWWQNKFEEKHCEITIGENRADVTIGDFVYEFQHSQISEEKIKARGENASRHGKNIRWVVDCTKSIDVREKSLDVFFSFTIENQNVVIKTNIEREIEIIFKCKLWKYKNFSSEKFLYIDDGVNIYKINTKLIKHNHVIVSGCKTRESFIEACENNTELDFGPDIAQCKMNARQRGAGNGKTYDGIQLINHAWGDTFFYLTKSNSGVSVIKNELETQFKNEDLEVISLVPYITEDEKKFKYFLEHKNGKKIIAIIGTIDSFIWNAAGNIGESLGDVYVAKALHVRENGVRDSFRYADEPIRLNHNSVIIIDEAQDLETYYLDAMIKTMEQTHADVYVIGDCLQSLGLESNIMTYLDKNIPENTKVNFKRSKNIVRRFHNSTFMDFVNQIVPFEQYGLKKITSICREPHFHENTPPTLLLIPEYHNKSIKNLDKCLKKITDEVKSLVFNHNYKPKDFLFIFPFIKENKLAQDLCDEINNIFREKYQNFNSYAKLHHSEEGQPINLLESSEKARIVSIHASKGDGRNAVFVIGLSDLALFKYSKGKRNIVYESFIHVAITRMKRFLYISMYENQNDEIAKRLSSYFGTIGRKIVLVPSLRPLAQRHDIKNICEKLEISITDSPDFIFKKNLENPLLDWGHHKLGQHLFKYGFCRELHSRRNLRKDQFTYVSREIFKNGLERFKFDQRFSDYKLELNKITDTDKKNRIIPFLKDESIICILDSILTVGFFVEFVVGSLVKKFKREEYPILCPLESIIFYYIWDVYDHGRFATFISQSDLYDITKEYAKDPKCNDEFECVCRSLPKKENTNSIIANFYGKNCLIQDIYHQYSTNLAGYGIDCSLLRYNNEKVIEYKNGDIKIKHRLQLYAEYEDVGIIIIFKPNFSDTDKHKIVKDSIVIANFILKVEPHKKVYTCVISFSQDIFFFENPKKSLSSALEVYFKNRHETDIRLVLEYCIFYGEKINEKRAENNDEELEECMGNIDEELEEYKDCIPDYIYDLILDFFERKINIDDLESELMKNSEKIIANLCRERRIVRR